MSTAIDGVIHCLSEILAEWHMLYIYLLNLTVLPRAPSETVEGTCSVPERTFQAFLWQEVPGSEALHLETPSSSLYCCQGQKMNFFVIFFSFGI